MSDNKKLIYYSIAGVAAIAVIGVGLYIASSEDEYADAKKEIEKMGRIRMIMAHEVGGQVIDLE